MPFIRELFKSPQALEGGFLRRTSSTGATPRRSATFNSISRRFIADLSALLTELGQTEPHFVRCIKPNAEAAPRIFNSPLVLEQLRCSGLIDAVEMMKQVLVR